MDSGTGLVDQIGRLLPGFELNRFKGCHCLNVQEMPGSGRERAPQ
jgi:hypothetical protein